MCVCVCVCVHDFVCESEPIVIEILLSKMRGCGYPSLGQVTSSTRVQGAH